MTSSSQPAADSRIQSVLLSIFRAANVAHR
jgi:hypothetical protein